MRTGKILSLIVAGSINLYFKKEIGYYVNQV